jgi:hypothetical protein
MMDVNQSERDALVVRGYLAEEERDNGAAPKKAIEGVLSDIAFELQSLLSALELASDRQIRRNASQVGKQFSGQRVAAATTGALATDTRHRGGAAVGVRNSS